MLTLYLTLLNETLHVAVQEMTEVTVADAK